MRKDKWNKLFDIIEIACFIIFIIGVVGGLIYVASLFAIDLVRWLMRI